MNTEQLAFKVASLFRIRGLTPNAKLLLILIEIANKDYIGKATSISVEEIMRWLDCSEKTVLNIRDQLHAKDLIITERHNVAYPYEYTINYTHTPPIEYKLPGKL